MIRTGAQLTRAVRWRSEAVWRRYLAAPLLRAGIRWVPGDAAKSSILRQFGDYMDCGDHPYTVRISSGTLVAGNTVDLIQRYLYVFGVWEPNLTAWIERQLKDGDTFVDVGANIGYYSLLASRLIGPRGKVVAIEASPEIFGKLEHNLRLNRISNVRTINAAAADRVGELPLFRAEDWNSGKSSTLLGEGSVFEATVPAAPLAQMLSPDEVRGARVIKIDVEGAECSVVAGLAPILSQLREDAEVVVELAPERLTHTNERVEDIVGVFATAGLHPYMIENEYRSVAYLRRRKPVPPVRIREPITSESDVIFSRRDVEVL